MQVALKDYILGYMQVLKPHRRPLQSSPLQLTFHRAFKEKLFISKHSSLFPLSSQDMVHSPTSVF